MLEARPPQVSRAAADTAGLPERIRMDKPPLSWQKIPSREKMICQVPSHRCYVSRRNARPFLCAIWARLISDPYKAESPPNDLCSSYAFVSLVLGPLLSVSIQRLRRKSKLLHSSFIRCHFALPNRAELICQALSNCTLCSSAHPTDQEPFA